MVIETVATRISFSNMNTVGLLYGLPDNVAT